jgi:uncharacterized protein
MANRLGSERSAYLRSAAHQPVHWLPWGKEAFALAKQQDKPVLLDIGAVWCHWCHVIDRESYDDPALAEVINQHFVPVKVDRDERPDVDARYQLAVQALTGQGGWPLTAFLTPEGKVFFGGTYFPPDDKYGRPGFGTVLQRIREAWRDRREDLLAHGEHLHQELARHGERTSPGQLREGLVDEAIASMAKQADLVNGGFGTAPKFPHPSATDLLLARWARSREPFVQAVLATTLDGMAQGGIRDHLGGGFHRYSVDAEWVVPHFEKMLYDNAGLLRNYAWAWALLGEPRHRDAAEGVVRWLREVMASPDGGFAGSQDADVGLDDDGDHWTWTLDELHAAVPDRDLAALLAEHFDVGARGEMHHDPRKNVLFVAKDAPTLAQERGLPLAMVEQRLAQGKQQMLAARQQRPIPYVDRSLFTSWNAMVAGALLDAGRFLGDAWATKAALRTLDRLLREAYAPDRGMAHVLQDGGAQVHGLLEDQAWMAKALLEAYEVAGRDAHLDAAEDLLRLLLDRFEDPHGGGLLDTARGLHDTEGIPSLEVRRKPIEDAPSASPTSVACLALLQAADLTGNDAYRAAAERILQAFAGNAPRMGLFAGAYFLAVERLLHPATHVVIVGTPGDPAAQALHQAALRTPDPLLVVSPPAEGAHVPEVARQALLAGVGEGGAVALVCKGASCSAPVRSPEELQRLLASPGKAEGPAVRWGPVG